MPEWEHWEGDWTEERSGPLDGVAGAAGGGEAVGGAKHRRALEHQQRGHHRTPLPPHLLALT